MEKPYNTDGSFHECRDSTSKKGNDKPQQQVKQEQKQPQTTLTLESIDKRLKRIEFTLFGKEDQ